MIKIKTQKEVNGKGELGYRIIEFIIPTLPKAFLEKEPNFHLETHEDDDGEFEVLYITPKNQKDLCLVEGGFYTREEMTEFANEFKRCVKHLREVERELENLRESWNGEAIFEF